MDVRSGMVSVSQIWMQQSTITHTHIFLAFQTAVALADFGGEKDEEGRILLKDDHVQQNVHMSKEFKAYLNDLQWGDEAKRAYK